VVFRGILIHFNDGWGKIVITEDLGAFWYFDNVWVNLEILECLVVFLKANFCGVRVLL
jgi:hypothetical protein